MSASLTALLKMDGSNFNAGIDGAIKKLSPFEVKIRSVKSGLKDTKSILTGVAHAASTTTGPLGDMVSALKGVVSAFAANPILGVITLIVTGITALATHAEKMADKALEASKKAVEEFKKNQDKLHKLMGIGGSPEEQAQIDSEKADLAGAKAKLYDAKKRLQVADEILKENKNASNKDQLISEYTTALGVYKIWEEVYNKLQDAETKRIEDSNKKLEEYSAEQKKQADNDFKEKQKMADQEAKAEDDRLKKWYDSSMKIKKDAASKVLDLQNKSFSTRFDADSYSKVGATIGRGFDPNLRVVERQLEVQRETQRIVADCRQRLTELVQELRGDGT